MNYLSALISLSKPNIILSVGLTGLTGMVLAKGSFPEINIIFYTLLSLILSAAGAAMVNNLIEKDSDKLMKRLSSRVESLNLIGPMNLTIIASFLITFSLGISFFKINIINFYFTLAAILSYTIYYTLFLKKSSPFGTVLGGIPGALPVLIGFAAINPDLSISFINGVVMFTFMMLWQPPHFWLLAQFLAEDYKNAGFPVMPIVYGKTYTDYLIIGPNSYEIVSTQENESTENDGLIKDEAIVETDIDEAIVETDIDEKNETCTDDETDDTDEKNEKDEKDEKNEKDESDYMCNFEHDDMSKSSYESDNSVSYTFNSWFPFFNR